MEGYFLFFHIFCVDLFQKINTYQKYYQPAIQDGAAAGIGHIQQGFAYEDSTEHHMHPADLFQIGGDSFRFNVFQIAFGIKDRVTKEGKNASGIEINTCNENQGHDVLSSFRGG